MKIWLLSLVLLCLVGCYSVEKTPSSETGATHIIVMNYGWHLFNTYPLMCGNTTAEEDGRMRPTIRNGTWYMDGKPVFWLGGWLHGNRTTDWPKKNPDRQGIGHVAYTTPPSAELFEKIGFNSSQISHAPVQAGRALMGLPISGGKKGFEETEREDADFIRGFGDVPMVVDFAYGFAAEIPKADRMKLDQVTDWWHLFIPFCPEHPEGNRYYESYFLGGTRTLMRYGMNVFIYELFNESSYCCACPANVQSFTLAMKRKYGTIAAANAQWGTDFDGFRDVAVRTGFSDAAGAYYDWCLFLGDRYAELLRKYKATVRSADCRKNVYITEQSAGEPPPVQETTPISSHSPFNLSSRGYGQSA